MHTIKLWGIYGMETHSPTISTSNYVSKTLQPLKFDHGLGLNAFWSHKVLLSAQNPLKFKLYKHWCTKVKCFTSMLS